MAGIACTHVAMGWIGGVLYSRVAWTCSYFRGPEGRLVYVGPRLTYINLPSDPLKQERVRATREHSTPPIQPIATLVHATLAISPLPVRGRPFS